ncbi:MAG: hypothetical protein HOW73_42735 [Polyangiaceae bacterium]|nr:hypothetical protein [Polyangiaceae bacterium]
MKLARLIACRTSIASLGIALSLTACAAGASSGETGSDDGVGAGGDGAGGDAAGGGAPGFGGFGGFDASSGAGGEGTGGGVTTPEIGPALKIRAVTPSLLVDTSSSTGARCGAFAPIGAGERRVVVDFDDCALDVDGASIAVGIVGSVTVRSTATTDLEVFVGPASAGSGGEPHIVGPLVTTTHGFTTLLDEDRMFAVEVPGNAAADVAIELTAVLVPESEDGSYFHLLEQPLRWYAANPNDDGFRDPWLTMGTVHRYPVLGDDEGATGMFGAVHLGPGVWRDNPVSFHMGPADAPDVTRWSTAPADSHFPWRYSSLFFVGASNGEVELRASSDFEPPTESGIEPWVDAIGWLSPSSDGGLVYRPLTAPLEATVVAQNDETFRLTTNLPEAKGVVGSIDFELPPFNPPQGYRWFHVMVGATEDTFPGALGGGLEGPDWMTAGLNQNGRVTVRFITKTDGAGAFVIRHYAFTSGGATGVFPVPTHVRVDAVLTDP